MEQVTFIVENKKDKNLLIVLAEKLVLKKYFITKEKNEAKNNKRADLLKIIDAGVDVSNFGDTSEWQREIRKSSNNFY